MGRIPAADQTVAHFARWLLRHRALPAPRSWGQHMRFTLLVSAAVRPRRLRAAQPIRRPGGVHGGSGRRIAPPARAESAAAAAPLDRSPARAARLPARNVGRAAADRASRRADAGLSGERHRDAGADAEGGDAGDGGGRRRDEGRQARPDAR